MFISVPVFVKLWPLILAFLINEKERIDRIRERVGTMVKKIQFLIFIYYIYLCVVVWVLINAWAFNHHHNKDTKLLHRPRLFPCGASFSQSLSLFFIPNNHRNVLYFCNRAFPDWHKNGMICSHFTLVCLTYCTFVVYPYCWLYH